jgi:hypothetical protein
MSQVFNTIQHYRIVVINFKLLHIHFSDSLFPINRICRRLCHYQQFCQWPRHLLLLLATMSVACVSILLMLQ